MRLSRNHFQICSKLTVCIFGNTNKIFNGFVDHKQLDTFFHAGNYISGKVIVLKAIKQFYS